MSELLEHDLALLIAKHHRLEPMTSRDRCTCGYVTPLGKLFSTHIAKEILDTLRSENE